MVLLHLSQLSLQVWQRPYLKQTHTYHVGPAVLLESVHAGGSVHPSDKFREDSRKWSTAGDIKHWKALHHGCEHLSGVCTGESSNLSPPAQDRGCCSAPLLLLPLTAQAEIVWAGAGPAEASQAEHLSERLRAAWPSTSHLRDQWWVMSKEGS